MKKDNQNKGRSFYVCPVSDRREQCGLFVWKDDTGATSNITCSMATTNDSQANTTEALATDRLFAEAGLEPCVGLYDLCPLPNVHSIIHRHISTLLHSAQNSTCWSVEQGTSDWFAGRSCRVTASIAAAAAGLSAYQTPTDVARSLLWKIQQDGIAIGVFICGLMNTPRGGVNSTKTQHWPYINPCWKR